MRQGDHIEDHDNDAVPSAEDLQEPLRDKTVGSTGKDASFRLNTGTRPIVSKYRKGKLKRTLRWYMCMLEESLLY